MSKKLGLLFGLIFFVIIAVLIGLWPETELAQTPSPSAIFDPTATPSLITTTPQPTALPTTLSIAPTPAPVQDLPREIDLPIPFTPQAPTGNWELPFQEYCEEAAVLMVYRYLSGQAITDPVDVTSSLRQIQEYEESVFGFYQDTNAEQTAKILSDFYNIPNVSLVSNPTIAELKAFLDAGQPIIVPTAGRLLNNPYYTPPGPIYHMLVIKGYTPDGRFITNDPGTKHGADYIYDAGVIMNAMHDWNNGDVATGDKVVIVAGP